MYKTSLNKYVVEIEFTCGDGNVNTVDYWFNSLERARSFFAEYVANMMTTNTTEGMEQISLHDANDSMRCICCFDVDYSDFII